MSKYHNIRVVVDNTTFDSKAEARRYGQLKLLQQTGHIWNLRVHPRYDIKIGGVKVCTYVGDFEYSDLGGVRVEDVKGVKTAVFKLKAKLMKVVNGIEVECV